MKEKNIEIEMVDPQAQMENGLRRIFNHNIAFHHTVLREDLDMTYGGLHVTRKGAVEARNKIITKIKKSAWSGRKTDNGKKVGFSQSQVNESAAKFEKQSKVVELKQGEEYSPYGDIKRSRTHGVDDGTHKSKRLR